MCAYFVLPPGYPSTSHLMRRVRVQLILGHRHHISHRHRHIPTVRLLLLIMRRTLINDGRRPLCTVARVSALIEIAARAGRSGAATNGEHRVLHIYTLIYMQTMHLFARTGSTIIQHGNRQPDRPVINLLQYGWHGFGRCGMRTPFIIYAPLFGTQLIGECVNAIAISEKHKNMPGDNGARYRAEAGGASNDVWPVILIKKCMHFVSCVCVRTRSRTWI